MKLKRVKSEKEITLKGQVTVEIETRDGSPKAVTIRDAEGNFLNVRGDYGVEVTVKEPPKMVKRWVVSATFLEAKLTRTYVDKSEAQDAASILSDKGADDIEIENVEVEAED